MSRQIQSARHGTYDGKAPPPLSGIFPQYLKADEVILDGSKEEVWQVLESFDSYHEWNRFTPKVETTGLVGTPIKMDVKFPAYDKSKPPGQRDLTQIEEISIWQPQKAMGWISKMGVHWLLSTERVQLLEDVDASHTRYISFIRLSGLMAPIITLTFGNKMVGGFNEAAYGLQEHLQKSHLPSSSSSSSSVRQRQVS